MAKSVAGILVAVMAVAAMALADSAGTGLAQAQTNTSNDRDALVALYNAADGPNWRTDTNWLSDRPLGEWHGVSTDGNGPVTGLDLSSNRLSGAIQWARHRVGPFQQPAERGDTAGTAGTGQPLQPGGIGPLPKPAERRDTGGTGQPRQPGVVGPQRQPAGRGDTSGTGQPRQPGVVGPQRQPAGRGDTSGTGQPR